jgi:hypothetical protein
MAVPSLYPLFLKAQTGNAGLQIVDGLEIEILDPIEVEVLEIMAIVEIIDVDVDVEVAGDSDIEVEVNC